MNDVKRVTAQIVRVNPLTDSILQLFITPDEYIPYYAGQYLQILHHDEAISYSIANAPLGAHQYELHIRHTRDNPFNQSLLNAIKEQGSVDLLIPFGTCHIKALDPQRPILFVAGGTGFAPVKAIIEQLLANSDPRPFELYWGARSQSDLYMDDKTHYWRKHVSNFQYFSSLSAKGKLALATDFVNRHTQDLFDWQVVISGPFDLVYKTRDYLVDQGMNKEQLFSDAFSFEAKQD